VSMNINSQIQNSSPSRTHSFVTKVRTFKIILILIILFYHCPVLLDDISVTVFV
jgi:hypothetical protein